MTHPALAFADVEFRQGGPRAACDARLSGLAISAQAQDDLCPYATIADVHAQDDGTGSFGPPSALKYNLVGSDWTLVADPAARNGKQRLINPNWTSISNGSIITLASAAYDDIWHRVFLSVPSGYASASSVFNMISVSMPLNGEEVHWIAKTDGTLVGGYSGDTSSADGAVTAPDGSWNDGSVWEFGFRATKAHTGPTIHPLSLYAYVRPTAGGTAYQFSQATDWETFGDDNWAMIYRSDTGFTYDAHEWVNAGAHADPFAHP